MNLETFLDTQPFSVTSKRTRWINQTDRPMRLKIHVGSVDASDPSNPFLHVDVEPGAAIELPSVLDRALHDVRNIDGKPLLCGGIAPLLLRENQKYPLHPSLIPEATEAAPKPRAPGDITPEPRRDRGTFQ